MLKLHGVAVTLSPLGLRLLYARYARAIIPSTFEPVATDKSKNTDYKFNKLNQVTTP